MNTSNLKRWLYFSLSLAFVFAGTALFYGLRSQKYERHIINQSEASLSALVSGTEQMAQGLVSLQYGGDGMALAQTAAQIYASSQEAKAALGALPLNGIYAEKYEKLINQAGEFSLSLLVSAAGGAQIGSKETASLASVANALEIVNSGIGSIKESMDVGEVMCGGIVSSGKSPCLSSEFQKLENDFPVYEALNYDGGFSEHITTMSPMYTAGMDELSQKDAMSIAEDFMGTEGKSLKLLYESHGTIPVYAFGVGKNVVEITKSGGIVLTYSNRRSVASARLSKEDALQKAAAYAEKLGFKDLYCRYSSVKNNILTAEFFPRFAGVVAYADRVTVGVALDNGALVEFDSRDYVMSHTDRNLNLPGIIPEGASLALVPTEGMGEKLCFEYSLEGCLRFVCTESGECYKVHVFEEEEQEGLSDPPLPAGSFTPKM